jgi:hypothetical protein
MTRALFQMHRGVQDELPYASELQMFSDSGGCNVALLADRTSDIICS